MNKEKRIKAFLDKVLPKLSTDRKTCKTCKGKMLTFRNEVSLRIFMADGICQDCQDKIAKEGQDHA